MKLFFSILFVLNVFFAPAFLAAQQAVSAAAVVKQDGVGEIEITAIENRIKVSNAPLGSKLQIFSVVGIKVKEFEIKQSDSEYVLTLAKGYYIIRIGETVRKIAIR